MENKCRVCGEGEENVEYVWACRKARGEAEEKWLRVIEKMELMKRGM